MIVVCEFDGVSGIIVTTESLLIDWLGPEE